MQLEQRAVAAEERGSELQRVSFELRKLLEKREKVRSYLC
jgi:type II secretory pathway component PulF